MRQRSRLIVRGIYSRLERFTGFEFLVGGHAIKRATIRQQSLGDDWLIRFLVSQQQRSGTGSNSRVVVLQQVGQLLCVGGCQFLIVQRVHRGVTQFAEVIVRLMRNEQLKQLLLRAANTAQAPDQSFQNRCLF